MTAALGYALGVLLVVVALVVAGLRRREPAWVIGGNIIGSLILFLGVWWAAQIGSDAFWAAMVAVIGIAFWGQIEFLWWRRRIGR